MSVLQDSSFLYMGRLLEGFGVGIISYTVSISRLHAFLFVCRWFMLRAWFCKVVCCSVRGRNINWAVSIFQTKWSFLDTMRTLKAWTSYNTQILICELCDTGTSIHSRDISSEHERSSWRCKPGVFILPCILSFCYSDTWLVYLNSLCNCSLYSYL